MKYNDLLARICTEKTRHPDGVWQQWRVVRRYVCDDYTKTRQL